MESGLLGILETGIVESGVVVFGVLGVVMVTVLLVLVGVDCLGVAGTITEAVVLTEAVVTVVVAALLAFTGVLVYLASPEVMGISTSDLILPEAPGDFLPLSLTFLT